MCSRKPFPVLDDEFFFSNHHRMTSWFGLASVTRYVILCSDKYFPVLADESFFNVICPEQLFDVIMVLWTRHDLVVFFCIFAGYCGFCCGGVGSDARCILYHHASCTVIGGFCHEVIHHHCCILWDNRTQACLPSFIFKQSINNQISLSHTPVIRGLLLSNACVYLIYFLMTYKHCYFVAVHCSHVYSFRMFIHLECMYKYMYTYIYIYIYISLYITKHTHVNVYISGYI